MAKLVGEVPWLSAEELHFWMPLIAMAVTLPAALDAQLKRDSGLNLFEYTVLAALSESPKTTLQSKDLAALARGSLSRVSHAVTRLERAGWVERKPSSEGGRHTDVRLTPAGRAKVRSAAPGHVREARRLVLDVLSTSQMALLRDAARTVLAASDEALLEQVDVHLPRKPPR